MEKTMNKMGCTLLVKVQGAGKNWTEHIMGTDEPSFAAKSEADRNEQCEVYEFI